MNHLPLQKQLTLQKPLTLQKQLPRQQNHLRQRKKLWRCEATTAPVRKKQSLRLQVGSATNLVPVVTNATAPGPGAGQKRRVGATVTLLNHVDPVWGMQLSVPNGML